MSRLSEAGEQVSETWFNALVINGLPEKYEHFVVQESFNPTSTFTELRTRLQNYEDSRMQRKQTEDNSSVAVYSANKQGQGRNKSSPSPSKGKDCYVCGNPGHFAKQCNKRSTATCSICKKKRHLAKACGNAEKTRKDGNAVSSYANCFIRSLLEESNDSEKETYLIVDTGCTDHIVNQKNVFENLRPCNEKSVTDPKGNQTAVEGIGDVPITVQLKDRKMSEMVLRNVLYVPSYKVNPSLSRYSRQFWSQIYIP